MELTISKLTVYFEDPFWVGVYERTHGGRYEVCKVTFGAEPKDYEVWDFFLQNWRRLQFSPSIPAAEREERRVNPKRMQRQIQKQLQTPGVGTKAQQALKLQQEQGKLARKSRSREMREAEAERRFALRQEKRREKHKGH